MARIAAGAEMQTRVRLRLETVCGKGRDSGGDLVNQDSHAGRRGECVTVAFSRLSYLKAGNGVRRKRPNHRIHGLKADVLSFASNGGLGFGSVFRHQYLESSQRCGLFFIVSALLKLHNHNHTGGAYRLIFNFVTL